MSRAFLVLSAGLLSALGLAPSVPETFVVEDGSRFWIDGTTSVSSFECEAPYAAGFGNVEQPSREGGASQIEAVVVVPVRAFDCGVRQMNRDLYEALRGRRYPAVRFELTRAELRGQPDAAGWAHVQAWGTLTLAGVERPVSIEARGRRLVGGTVEIHGQHPLLMTDFNIDPPRGPLGIVRARNQITVRFELVASSTG